MCGMPGTGKTATYLYVLGKMREEMEKGLVPQFTFLHVNCMKLSKPDAIYHQFAEVVLGKKCSESKVVSELNRHFKVTQSTRPKVVVLVDEIDALLTKKQEVLYHIFDWPTQAKSELIVTGISNTMDLAERFLPRVASRLGRHRIVFAPYRKVELEALVRQRLQETNVFSQEAVTFAATKIAGFSGDARRALQTCHLAAQLCMKDTSPQVNIEHIQHAHQELYSFSFTKALPQLPYLSKLLLLRLALKVKVKAGISVGLAELVEDMRTLGNDVVGTRTPTRTEMQDMLAVLGALRLLLVEGQVYKMMVSIDEVCQALQREERLARFLSLF